MDIVKKLKEIGAALWAPFVALGAFLLYGWWKEQQGRDKARYRQEKEKLERTKKAADESIKRAEERLKKRMKEREQRKRRLDELNKEIVKTVDEKRRESDELDKMGMDGLADRADELVGTSTRSGGS